MVLWLVPLISACVIWLNVIEVCCLYGTWYMVGVAFFCCLDWCFDWCYVWDGLFWLAVWCFTSCCLLWLRYCCFVGCLVVMVLLSCLLVSFACLVVGIWLLHEQASRLVLVVWRFDVVWCTGVFGCVVGFGVGVGWCFLVCFVLV